MAVKPRWSSVLLRSAASAIIFAVLFSAYEAFRGDPIAWLEILGIGAVMFIATALFERFVFPLWERDS